MVVSILQAKAIQHVLKSFEDMGASSRDLEAERMRLTLDEGYLDMWASVTGFYETAL